MPGKITIADIRRSYKEYMKGRKGIDLNAEFNLWGEGILRKFSYHLAWLFLRLGMSANHMTGIGLVISIIGCIFLASGDYWGTIAGALLLNTYATLDYADGHVARCTNSCSDFGRFFDFIADNSIAILFFTCIGIGVYINPDSWLSSLFLLLSIKSFDRGIYLVLGGLASVFYIFPLFTGYQFERLRIGDFTNFTDQLKIKSFPDDFVRIIGFNIFNVTGLIMPTLILASALNFLSVVLFLWAIIHIFGSIYMAFKMLSEARHE